MTSLKMERLRDISSVLSTRVGTSGVENVDLQESLIPSLRNQWSARIINKLFSFCKDPILKISFFE